MFLWIGYTISYFMYTVVESLNVKAGLAPQEDYIEEK